MPELPEVETTRRGIEPHLVGRRIQAVTVRDSRLRWPVPADLPERLTQSEVQRIDRRGKYLLLQVPHGTALVHLGMSGSMRIVPPGTPYLKHDHVILVLADHQELRFNDPRRFGAWLWTTDWPAHPLIRDLGPEPLSPEFDGDYLYRLSRGRRAPIKAFIMDHHLVVGVGNIYATEALFLAGIHPARAAGRVGRKRLIALAEAIKTVLAEAIAMGGTTLRDFVNSEGKPGYFAQSLNVYGRAGQSCHRCGRTLRTARLGQRASAYCPGCQT
ncbi:bifunctional DNA-formamidopyrimidine glycosylase/DNA-(apurinic or apyrimidinic site) lyase [Marinobacteraceae bacterium S3BR75-40.1]